ncbi:hypothetical protein [Phenylobacterium montanum]|uniref:Uncharacterized protein n=1 Tax=Phenylobacterium montanum TaxID=2823693 RepID=A0A975FXE6_9CAUL|nr:hypothetical protein [Caulobacter sp. S6]QUD86592.1 hypothetical protein KCG34_16065 [Caulobacter sp. S6]
MAILVSLLSLLFVAAQGAAVFATAYVVLRAFKIRHWLAKIAAIALSYVAWIAATVGGYFLTGGDGSFMKGFAVVMMLCLTALVSSLGYLLGWLLWPKLRGGGRLLAS